MAMAHCVHLQYINFYMDSSVE